jgi:hypothetical protein
MNICSHFGALFVRGVARFLGGGFATDGVSSKKSLSESGSLLGSAYETLVVRFRVWR